MLKKDMYKSLKEILLKDKEIVEVNINSRKGEVKIVPRQDKSYFNVGEILRGSGYKMDDGIYFDVRGGVLRFKVKDCSHCNTQVYHVILKEISKRG